MTRENMKRDKNMEISTSVTKRKILVIKTKI